MRRGFRYGMLLCCQEKRCDPNAEVVPDFCCGVTKRNMERTKLLIVVTSTGQYPGGKLKTGLWLSELTHIYHAAKAGEFDVVIASPKGGDTPVDPMSLKPIYLDKRSKKYWGDPLFREMLQNTESLNDVSGMLFDGIYLAGGHGSMFDFPDNADLQALVGSHYASGRTICAICHGVCGLLNVRLSDGSFLITDKKLTGFSWFEEILVGRSMVVPFNLEAALKERGADYTKALVPPIPKVVVDGKLITGQDPFSSGKMAETVMRELEQ